MVAYYVNDETVVEPDETFTVDLSNAVGATILDDQGLGAILNDENELLLNGSFEIQEANRKRAENWTGVLLSKKYDARKCNKDKAGDGIEAHITNTFSTYY